MFWMFSSDWWSEAGAQLAPCWHAGRTPKPDTTVGVKESSLLCLVGSGK